MSQGKRRAPRRAALLVACAVLGLSLKATSQFLNFSALSTAAAGDVAQAELQEKRSLDRRAALLASSSAVLSAPWVYSREALAAAPKTILVAGATGQTGKQIMERLASRSDVTLIGGVRNLDKAKKELPKSASFKSLDVEKDSVEKLASTLQGADALIIATGFDPLKSMFNMNAASHAVDNLGTRALVDAAKKAGVGKVVLVSSILTNARAWGKENSAGFQATNAFGQALDEKIEAEKYLRASGLDYTIVRPGGLENGGKGNLVVSKEDTLDSGVISRARVAEVSIAAAFDPKSSNKVVEIIESDDAPALPVDQWFASG
eukprot:gb/GFBE01063092.1/.p1 GENE.gb/GFBE01063092.1/~~gb/GFBE01063092.1/.p1  ORF type:complete len:319 (+),score=73.99 gb/GFBE01063092.1/:1-957(+)